MEVSKSTKVKTIGFRLDPKSCAQLEQQAGITGVTEHELARQIVLGFLEGEQGARTSVRLAAMETELGELRRDLAVAVEALLVITGKVAKEEAKEWVRENLRRN